MKKWKPERRDGLLLLGIGLGAAVGLLRGAVLAWLPVGVALGPVSYTHLTLPTTERV